MLLITSFLWLDMVIYCIAGIVALLLLLLLIAVIRTLFNGKKLAKFDNFQNLDNAKAKKYASTLAEMLKFETIAVKVGGKQEIFDKYYEKLKELYPATFATSEIIPIEKAYVFKIKGKTNKGLPTLLMSHSDIVEAQGKWKYDAFSGTIADDIIWGRGTMDTKGMLASFMIAINNLLSQGFVPEDDLYVLSTHDEEVFGVGAFNTNDYFIKNNIKFRLILDEGGVLTEKMMPGITNDLAVIGVTEKGYLDVKFTADSKGGHSSTPPKNTPIARLSDMVHEIEHSKVFKRRYIKPVKDMFKTVSPYMTFPLRLMLSNFWLFGGLLKNILPKVSSKIAAMLQTTIVFTQAKGSGAPNVIPQSAEMVANLRNLPGDNKEFIMAKLNAIASKYDIRMEEVTYKPDSSIANTSSEAYQFLKNCIESQFKGVIVTPYVMLGGTDSCKLDTLSESVFRFSPIRASKEQVETVHGVDENIGVKEFCKSVEFFEYMIKQL